jgi:hypothetical protein
MPGDIWESGGVAPPFLMSTLDGGEWSHLHAPVAFPLENHPRYPMDRRKAGPQNRPGRHEEKNLALTGIRSVVQGVAFQNPYAVYFSSHILIQILSITT